MERFKQLSAICCLAVVVSASNDGNDRQDINLSNDGGYTDILIAIDESVPENPDIITKLQKYFTEASPVLLKATKDRLFFKAITILVPPTWTYDSAWSTPSQGETYSKARVKVAEASEKWGDIPYTLQNAGCGEEAMYTHFTPEYLTRNSADKTYKPAKKIVKEFAKLRWGLFDEVVENWQTAPDPIGCTGPYYSNRTDTTSGQSCIQLNSTCHRVLISTDRTASLLAFEYLDGVVEFCSDTDPTEHITAAINDQNKNCNDRSAWEVMRSLPDFGTDYSITRPNETITAPVFNIVQTRGDNSTSDENTGGCEQDMVCLCLDTSQSMDTNNRIGIMSQAVKSYILAHLRNGTAVGIVSFSAKITLLSPMTVISVQEDRIDLDAKVPNKTDGSQTRIGGGLQQCQTILREYGKGNSRIVLFSDGGETNHPPLVADVLPSIIEDGIIVDTILYGRISLLPHKCFYTP